MAAILSWGDELNVSVITNNKKSIVVSQNINIFSLVDVIVKDFHTDR